MLKCIDVLFDVVGVKGYAFSLMEIKWGIRKRPFIWGGGGAPFGYYT